MKLRKLAALVIASAMTLSCMSGGAICASADDGGEVITLRMWGGVPEESGPQKVCDNFNEAFKDKGIQVEYERFVNDDTGNLKLETNLLSGTDVDLYMSYGLSTLAKRAEGGMALDLTELMERDGFDDKEYFSMAESCYVDGKPYCLPTKLDQYGILLNMDMFEAAGIEIPTEWTFDEFREIAKQLTTGEGDDKVYGFFWNSQQDLTYIFPYLIAPTLGGDTYYKSETESAFDDPVIKAAVQLEYDMMNVDGSSPTHTDSVTQQLSQEGMFLTGKAAMTIGSWIVRNVKDTENYPHDFKTAFAPYPVISEDQRNYAQGSYGDLLSINPKSEHVDAAWEFAKWYATEGMLPVVGGGRVPSSNTFDVETVTNEFLAGAEDLLDAESTKNVLIAPHENYAVQSITVHSNEIAQIIKEDMELILIDQMSVDDGLADMKTRADAILAE